MKSVKRPCLNAPVFKKKEDRYLATNLAKQYTKSSHLAAKSFLKDLGAIQINKK